MGKSVGIRFRENGKIYDFDTRGMTLLPGELVVVETARGAECGRVVRLNRDTPETERSMKPVLRRADDIDRRRKEENEQKEREAMRICQERIEAHHLDMKLVDAEYAFDGTKILFNFTAEGRVDFRGLVKDLAGVFHTRIELHQIGVRDEAKKLGGIGICGQPFCCARFLKDFQPVSIKMAKEQGLSLNPTKISGSCGRLMCCLKYEQNVYDELCKLSPRVGAVVTTPEGRGVVTDSVVLTGRVKVRLDKTPDSPPIELTREDVQVIRSSGSGKPRSAEVNGAAEAAGGGEPADRPRSGNGKSHSRGGRGDTDGKASAPAEKEKP